MRTKKRLITVLAPVFALLVACSSGGSGRPAIEDAGRGTPSLVPAARPAVAADYPAASDTSCDPRQSLTPLAELPEPGRMPAGSTMEAIRAKGYLSVGVDQNTLFFASLKKNAPPVDGRSKIEGFDIDMAEEVGKAIFGDGPSHVRYTVITQAQRIEMLQSDKVDLVIDTMTITCDRKKQVAFSGNYYDDGQKILVPYDSSAQRIEDLAGRRVCTARGTTSIATLRDKGVQPYAVDNWTDCLVALQRNEVDAVSTTGALLGGLQAQDADTEVRGPRFTDEPHGMAVRLDRTDFVRFLNTLLRDMLADGRWMGLYDTWLRGPLRDETEDPRPVTRYAG